MENRFVYADYAATAGVTDEVLQKMLPYFKEEYGNASSVYSIGRNAKKAIETARKEVAEAIGCEPAEIYFTGSGTEADNWAVSGIAKLLISKGKKHIITSVFEHHAILHTCRELEKQHYEVTYVPCDKNGLISPKDIKSAIREDTALVTIMYANNEIGTIQPIKEIAAVCHDKGVLFHTDAVQAIGNAAVNVKEQGIDLLSLSGHKIHAQKGVGALYVKKGIALPNLLYGGGQEHTKRPGTENVPAIVGLGAAITIAVSDIPSKTKVVTAMRNRLIDGILQLPQTRLNGDRERRLAGNCNISIEGIEGESLLLMLDRAGICASSGSACTSGSIGPSHVLLALGLTHETARGSLRLSISEDTTDEEITYILGKIPPIVERLRNMPPLREKGE